MMRSLSGFLFAVLIGVSVLSCTNNTQKPESKAEIWRFALMLDGDELPFTAKIEEEDGRVSKITLYNAAESIELSADKSSVDTLIFNFPVYPSRLVIRRESPQFITGFWEDFDRPNYRIPLVAERGKDFRFTPTKSTTSLSHRYRVRFGSDTVGHDAVLELTNKTGLLTGTFLTESGDYRYAAGNIMNGKVNLSTFDGNHAWLFDADISGDSLLNGRFLSGTHYRTTWSATADSVFTLSNPAEISAAPRPSEPFKFRLPDQNGDTIHALSFYEENLIHIFQITGSWCPNCKDASIALHKLTSEYGKENVSLVPIHFERYSDFGKAKDRIVKMQTDLGLPYRYLFGGKASREQTAAALPDLDAVRAYPTIVITDREGRPVKIFSGFYGPGTGVHHDNLMQDIRGTLDGILRPGRAHLRHK